MNAAIFSGLFFLLSVLSPGISHAAEVQGKVSLEGGETPEGVEATLFDGFTATSSRVGQDGEFLILNSRITEEAEMILYAVRKGYLPEFRLLKGGVIRDLSIRLGKMADTDKGVIAGSLHTPMSGGKLKPQFGIYHIVPEREVTLTGDAGHWEMKTDREGRFLFAVPPGRYRLKAEGNPREYPVTVSIGETTLQNIPIGRVLVD